MLTQSEMEKLLHDLKGIAYLIELLKREYDKLHQDMEEMAEKKNNGEKK